MSVTPPRPPDPGTQLRLDAEARLAHAPPPRGPERSAEELVHELQVHQIELEMQNETLRQAQVDVEQSRDRYFDLYELAPVGYLTLTEAGQIAEINLTGTAMLHEERAGVLHRPFAQFVAGANRDGWQQLVAQALNEGTEQTCELLLERGDGTAFDARLDCRPIAERGGAPRLRITLSDISVLKETMNDLRLREDRLRLAKEAAGLGIFDHDIANGPHEWDERMREIWGLSPDEPVTYAKFMAGVHPDDRAATQAAVDRALDPAGDGRYHAEYRVVSRAGGRLWHVSAAGRVFFDRGVGVRFAGTVADISTRKQQESDLQEQRREMDLLVNQQVAAQTAAAIAHELNQPLVSISAYSEAALRMLQAGAKDPEKLARALEGARTQAQRAGQTLHELLDFLHKGEAALEPVDLNGVVREALDLAAQSGYGGFRPVLDLESDLPPVLANRRQVQKVLVNLLHNAVQAMRGAGVPGEAIAITVRTAAGRNAAQVTVRDSGPGLDAATADRIFEPFFTTKTEGLGLGLAISRALIEAHGGQLWADTGRSVGATFHFTIPFAR